MADTDQECCFPQLVELFLSGDQPKKMQEYLIECGVNDYEFSGTYPSSIQESNFF